MQQALKAWVARFDQGPLGHERRKPTAVLTTAWSVYEDLHAIRGPGSGKEGDASAAGVSGFRSQVWARWAPGLVAALQKGWNVHVSNSPQHRRIVEASRFEVLKALSPEWQPHIQADHIPYRRDCEVCLQAASRDRSHFKQDSSAFYALSSDICGPLSQGQMWGLQRSILWFSPLSCLLVKAFHGSSTDMLPKTDVAAVPGESGCSDATPPMSAAAAVPGESDGSAAVPPVSDAAAVSEESCRSAAGPDGRPRGPGPLSGLVTGRVELAPCPEPAAVPLDLPSMHDLFSEDASLAVRAARGADTSAEVDFLAHAGSETGKDDPLPDSEAVEPPLLTRKCVTLIWAEPLENRRENNLRLAIMRAVARLRSQGVLVLRWHSDRAKEYSSKKLSAWMAQQNITESKTAPEDHAANGRAEVAVREMKSLARRWRRLRCRPSTGRWLFARPRNSAGVESCSG